MEGKLQTRDYTDRDGNRRYATEVVADNVYFGDSKRDGAATGGYSEFGGSSFQAPAQSSYSTPASGSYGGYSAPAQPSSDFSMLDTNDSDLPF